MSSVLKISVDLECQVYCDYEYLGEAYPNKLFRAELRKGTYIIEFEKDDIKLSSIKYEMKTNEEEDLLEISLSTQYRRKCDDIKSRKIAELDVCWEYVDDHWRINSLDDTMLNHTTCETFIDLPSNYNLLQFDENSSNNIDACGYIPFNLCGIRDTQHNSYQGGRWGCLNKMGEVVIQPIYGRKVFFENDSVVQVYTEAGIILKLINRFGEPAFPFNYDTVYSLDEKAGLYRVKKNDSYGVIDKEGRLIVPILYSSFIFASENKFWAKEVATGLWGLLDSNSSIIQPFVYDDVKEAEDGFFVQVHKKWGVILKDGSVKVSPKYEVVADYCITTYSTSNKLDDDYDFIYNYFCIVKVNGKYGIINTGLEKFDYITRTIDFNEVVSCKYDAIYSANGIRYSDEVLKDRVSPRVGMPDGLFDVEKSVFVIIRDSYLECDRYDKDQNLLDTFYCSEFNEIYKIEADKYYLRHRDLFYDKTPFDLITTIDFSDGSWDYSPIYGEDAEPGMLPVDWSKELLKRIYVVARKGDVCYVFGKDRSSILFKYRCDSILEFGITVDDNYFAIIEIGNYKRLVIADYNGKIEYESDNFKNIYSSYRLLSESASPDVMFKDECNLNSASNDYFIMQLESGKWKVLVYRKWNQKDYQSANYDSIRFIDEYRVEIHKYENGQKLYNGIYTGCWDDMSPVYQQWSNTPLVADK